MIKVNALTCPKCGDTIYSRARHDFRNCTCCGIFIDGGFDYMKCGGKLIKQAKVIKLQIEATKKELYNDWNTKKDLFGRIKGVKHESRKN